MDAFTSENFIANLRLLCSFYPSISEVCRRLNISRPQFMKYLSGASFPSRFKLRQICDFFGVDEYEVLAPHEQFRNIVRLKPGSQDNLSTPTLLRDVLLSAQREKYNLTRLLGYYYNYFFSASKPGHLVRALVLIYNWNDYTAYKRIERLKGPRASRFDTYKYEGLISLVGDRLHLIDTETLTGNELTHTILYPSYKNRLTMLSGLCIGVSGSDSHVPSASRTVYEFLGRNLNIKVALRGCGLFDPESTELPVYVRDYLLKFSDSESAAQLQTLPLRQAI